MNRLRMDPRADSSSEDPTFPRSPSFTLSLSDPRTRARPPAGSSGGLVRVVPGRREPERALPSGSRWPLCGYLSSMEQPQAVTALLLYWLQDGQAIREGRDQTTAWREP